MSRYLARRGAIILGASAILLAASAASAHDPREFGPFRAPDGQPVVPGPGVGASLAVAARPQQPVLDNFRVVGHLDVGGETWNGDVFLYDHGATVGKHAYVGNAGRPCLGKGISIIDVTDPSNPVRVGRAGEHEGVSNEDVVVRRIGGRDILGVGVQICGENGRAGLALFDVTDPSDPTELSFLPMPSGGVHELDMVVRPDGRALALLAVPFAEFEDVWFGGNNGGEFRIVDITDPTDPQEIADWGIIRGSDLRIPGGNDPISSSFQGLGNFPAIFVHSARGANNGMRAYVSYWDAGVLKFDISDPSDPQLVAHTLFRESADGDAHSVTPFEIGGSRYLFTNDEDSTPMSPALLFELGDLGSPEDDRDGHPVIELPWAPTLLSDQGELTRRVFDARDGCQESDFIGAAGRFVLIDAVDPFYEGIIEGWTVPCAIGGQALRAADAGARAIVFNMVSPDDAYPLGPRSARVHRSIQERAVGVPMVMVSDIDEVADRIRDRSAEGGNDERLTLRPGYPSYGFLRVFAEDTARDRDGDGIRDYAQVGSFAGLPNVQGDRFPAPGEWTIHNTEVLRHRAYSSWYSNGIVALEVTDPVRPRIVGRFVPSFPGRASSIGVWGVAVDPETNLIYASDIDQGLWVIRPRGAARALP